MTKHHKMRNVIMDKEYFFVLPSYSKGESLPDLRPDADTATKPYMTEVLPVGGKLLVQNKRGIYAGSWKNEEI